jgi:2-succinyl-5-enolpyruvyl-6-hydroxy-3-cyclohexene-1-carboxylate synthase
MAQLPIDLGDTLTSLAQTELGDWRRWRELADLNELNPLEGLEIGEAIEIPDFSQLTSQVQPILSSVAQGLNGIDGRLAATVQQAIGQVSGYVQEAEALVGEINGVLNGDVESIVTQVADKLGVRQYADEGVRLIDWLL